MGMIKSIIFAVAIAVSLTSTASVVFSAQERYFEGREYTIVFPNKNPGKQKYPLVLMLHGGLGNSLNLERALPFNQMAKRNGFIVVYPNGYPLRIAPRRKVWNAGGCCGRAMRDNVDDVGYLTGLIKSIVKKYPVNRRKIYIMGHSNGAMMAYRFACERPGMLAGIIPVSGPLMTESCKSGPVKVLHIHGENDSRVPFEGRRRIRPIVQNRPFRSVRQTKRILEEAGARMKVMVIRDAGHNISEIDSYMKEQKSVGIPGIIARFINDRQTAAK